MVCAMSPDSWRSLNGRTDQIDHRPEWRIMIKYKITCVEALAACTVAGM